MVGVGPVPDDSLNDSPDDRLTDMAINFPDAPALNYEFTDDNGVVWVWDGTGWGVKPSQVSIPNDPTLTGTTTINGDLVVERTGTTSRVYIESDTGGYLVFANEDGVSTVYADVPAATGEFILRKGDGTAFFRYDPADQEVTFPDGGVPATQITGDLDGGAPDSTF